MSPNVGPGLAALLPEIVMGLLVLVIARADIRSRRIPNALLWPGLGLAALTQFGRAGPDGLVTAGLGFAAGLIILLPMHLMRALGAGDVKMMAMVGAFFGPVGAAQAALLSVLAGGVLAAVFALKAGAFNQLIANVKAMLFGAFAELALTRTTAVHAPAASVGKLPYAVAIATGTLVQMVLLQVDRSLW